MPIYKYIKTLITLVILVTSLNIAYTQAVNCASFNAETLNFQDPNELKYILCPVRKIITIGIFASSAVLIVMLAYGGIKAALSFGEPKALMGAKNTWTWAVIGTFLVIIALSIVSMIFGMLGVGGDVFTILNIDSDIDSLWNALPSLLSP